MQMPPAGIRRGFRFDPTDVDLLHYYLKRHVQGLPLPITIPTLDVYGTAPWDLPPGFEGFGGFFYCFARRSRCSTNGKRVKRTLGSCGTWYGNKTWEVVAGGKVVGYRTFLSFKEKKVNTGWVMHEYWLPDGEDSSEFQDVVLCKIRNRKEEAEPACEKGKKVTATDGRFREGGASSSAAAVACRERNGGVGAVVRMPPTTTPWPSLQATVSSGVAAPDDVSAPVCWNTPLQASQRPLPAPSSCPALRCEMATPMVGRTMDEVRTSDGGSVPCLPGTICSAPCDDGSMAFSSDPPWDVEQRGGEAPMGGAIDVEGKPSDQTTETELPMMTALGDQPVWEWEGDDVLFSDINVEMVLQMLDSDAEANHTDQRGGNERSQSQLDGGDRGEDDHIDPTSFVGDTPLESVDQTAIERLQLLDGLSGGRRAMGGGGGDRKTSAPLYVIPSGLQQQPAQVEGSMEGAPLPSCL